MHARAGDFAVALNRPVLPAEMSRTEIAYALLGAMVLALAAFVIFRRYNSRANVLARSRRLEQAGYEKVMAAKHAEQGPDRLPEP